jgi:hypothetical protein
LIFKSLDSRVGTKGMVCKRGELVKERSELGLKNRKGAVDGTLTDCLLGELQAPLEGQTLDSM